MPGSWSPITPKRTVGTGVVDPAHFAGVAGHGKPVLQLVAPPDEGPIPEPDCQFASNRDPLFASNRGSDALLMANRCAALGIRESLQ